MRLYTLKGIFQFMPETFPARIIKNNRITIPKEVVAILDLKEGDYLQVSVEKKTVRNISKN